MKDPFRDPLQPATCRCGHKGKSRTPTHYQCGRCYYTARAKYNTERATELRAHADKLDAEAVEFKAKAEAFRKRNGLPK